LEVLPVPPGGGARKPSEL